MRPHWCWPGLVLGTQQSRKCRRWLHHAGTGAIASCWWYRVHSDIDRRYGRLRAFRERHRLLLGWEPVRWNRKWNVVHQCRYHPDTDHIRSRIHIHLCGRITRMRFDGRRGCVLLGYQPIRRAWRSNIRDVRPAEHWRDVALFHSGGSGSERAQIHRDNHRIGVHLWPHERGIRILLGKCQVRGAG